MQIPDADIERIGLVDQLYDIPGLSQYASMGVSTIRTHIKKGLPCFKVGGKLLIKRSEFDSWLEQFRLNKSQDLNSIVDSVIDDLKG